MTASGPIFRAGENDGPPLIFLHGLGAHAQVWRPMADDIEIKWPGQWFSMNLPGHGRGPVTGAYGLDDHAAFVAQWVRDWGLTQDFVILGHSMGGAVGMALASGRHGVMPRRVLALGVKVAWSDDEVAGLTRLAAAPAKTFATREEAIERFLKVSGLAGLADPWSDIAGKGVVQDRGQAQWRLAADPRTAEVGPPPMEALMAEARCPIRLAAGELDPMSKIEDLRRWDPDAVTLPGLGHNAMVEDPAAVWRFVRAECGLA